VQRPAGIAGVHGSSGLAGRLSWSEAGKALPSSRPGWLRALDGGASIGRPAGVGRGRLPGVLYGVAAVSADRAWAVGSAGGSSLYGPGRALVVEWNGRVWRRVSVPGLGKQAVLYGLAAVSGTDVWAVGERGARAYQDSGRTLLLHWNGQDWRQVASPVRAGSGFLEDVSASSAGNVWAAGESGTGEMLVMRWNGRAWRRIPTPRIQGELTSVAATSPRNVWAVGFNDRLEPVILHWDGSRWSLLRSPVRSGYLWQVRAADGQAWAVGGNFIPGKSVSIILHWNGVRWLRVASSGPYYLAGVAVQGRDSAWAVGANDSGPHQQVAILRWNGRVWRKVPSPGLGADAVLVGVNAASARSAWAVGALVRPHDAQTVIARWNGIRWVPASIMK
jgi:hypothetical protein